MQALGMETGAIADSQITASSEWNVKHSPERARLHTKETSNAIGAWASLTNDLNQWLQVDLNKITTVTHVATQGRNSRSPVQMVTKYKLQFSDDGASFLFYKRQGESSDAVNSNRVRRYSISLGVRRMIPVRRIIRRQVGHFFVHIDRYYEKCCCISFMTFLLKQTFQQRILHISLLFTVLISRTAFNRYQICVCISFAFLELEIS